MSIAERITRSRTVVPIDALDHFESIHIDEPLVPVCQTLKITVDPIWHNTTDLEGQLMRQYYLQTKRIDDVLNVRKELHRRLTAAAQSLSAGLQLVVYAGYRPIEVQQQVLAAFAQDYQTKHPDALEAEALAHARLFVSDPAIKIPPHCCGAAVDVSLYDTKTNQPVDMGSAINQADELSYLHATNITAQQRANRQVLLTAMLEAGFASYPTEWWHYSYGDPLWAWFYEQPTYLYDIVADFMIAP